MRSAGYRASYCDLLFLCSLNVGLANNLSFNMNVELVPEWTGLPGGGAKSVKRFERSNWLDTALYKSIPTFITVPLPSRPAGDFTEERLYKNYLYLFNIIWLLLNLFASWALKLSGEGANTIGRVSSVPRTKTVFKNCYIQ